MNVVISEVQAMLVEALKACADEETHVGLLVNSDINIYSDTHATGSSTFNSFRLAVMIADYFTRLEQQQRTR
ncbi:hypothetical protein ACFODL_15475 [Phenylobacterium terrae]|uniref:Uncharacterized protein n=1 Tax=Phenylobacterium terrae TaxID=2665495 RepID=A0ABW4N7D6_9CAUL